MPITSLPELLKVRARENADAPFLHVKDQVWSYAELDQTSDVVARELRLNRIEEGDRVALLLPNGPEWILAFFGILKLGAIAVPIGEAASEREIAAIVKNCGASAALLGRPRHPIAESLLAHCHTLKFTQKIESGESKRDVLRLLSPFQTRKELNFPFPEPDEAAAIIYPSRKAPGPPAGAVLSHGNYLFECEELSAALGMTSGDTFSCSAPLAQIEAQAAGLLAPLHCGGSLILAGKSDPAQKFSLEKIHGYGLPETTGYCSVNPMPPQKGKKDSVGLPLESQEMKLIGAGGRELPAGETGEIILRGPCLMQGYWENEDATAEVIKDGWLYTGDLGYRDKDGFFFVIGKK